jgi:hypothetical protein
MYERQGILTSYRPSSDDSKNVCRPEVRLERPVRPIRQYTDPSHSYDGCADNEEYGVDDGVERVSSEKEVRELCRHRRSEHCGERAHTLALYSSTLSSWAIHTLGKHQSGSAQLTTRDGLLAHIEPFVEALLMDEPTVYVIS